MFSLYDHADFSIYFGDRQDAVSREYLHWTADQFADSSSIQGVLKRLSCNQLLFLKQVHGTSGLLITADYPQNIVPFAREGDFLITNEPCIGIGVITADCVPVVCYDSVQRVVGIAHAGWRGAYAGVVEAMVAMMQKKLGSYMEDLQFFLGPSAQVCCYEVDRQFAHQFSAYPYCDLFVDRENTLYFDLPRFVQHRIGALGVDATQMNSRYQLCTICNLRFCSHRRATHQGTAHKEGRQMTIIALKQRFD